MRRPAIRQRPLLLLILSGLLALLAACNAAVPAPSAPASENAVANSETTETETDAIANVPAEIVPVTQTGSPAVLPAPLYYLSPGGQIMRLERDGVTSAVVTAEDAGIAEFDISPDGRLLAYVSGNDLILLDVASGARTVRLAGETFADDDYASYFTKSIASPRFSPDGTQIAFGMGGINIAGIAPDAPLTLVQPSDPYPDFSAEPKPPLAGPVRFFTNAEWSPDGQSLLLSFGYFPEGGGIAIKDLSTNKLLEVEDNGIYCCDLAWSDAATALIGSNIWAYGTPGLVRIDARTGAAETLIAGYPAGEPGPETPVRFVRAPFHASDGALYAFVSEQYTFDAPVAWYRLVRLENDGSLTPISPALFPLPGDVQWASDGSGVVFVNAADPVLPATYPLNNTMSWLPRSGQGELLLPIIGRHPRWGGPLHPVDGPNSAALAELAAQAAAGFGLQGADQGIGVRQLTTDGRRLLWAVYTTGMRAFDPLANHQVAIYAYDNGWLELARRELTSDDPAANGVSPDIVGDGSVNQVLVEPTHIWLTVEGVVGAHGGVFLVLNFDGTNLNIVTGNFNGSPDAGHVSDINGDGRGELLLNLTEPYVFAYASGVRLVQYALLRWDGSQLVPVQLTPLSDSAPAAARDATNQALLFADAGLWLDAQAAAQQAASAAPEDETAIWNAHLINYNTDAKRSAGGYGGAYPLLVYVFAGDYVTAVDVMRGYSAAQLFSAASPMIVGTAAEGWQEQLGQILGFNAGSALAVRPDLAPAYFLRAWGSYLLNPADPVIKTDLQKAVELAPADSLFLEALDLFP